MRIHLELLQASHAMSLHFMRLNPLADTGITSAQVHKAYMYYRAASIQS